MNNFLNLQSIMESEGVFEKMKNMFAQPTNELYLCSALNELSCLNSEFQELNKRSFKNILEAESKTEENQKFCQYFKEFKSIIDKFINKINELASRCVINIDNIVDTYKDLIEDDNLVNQFNPFSMEIYKFKNLTDDEVPKFKAKKLFCKEFDHIGTLMQDLGPIASDEAKLKIIASVYNSMKKEMDEDFLEKCAEKILDDDYDKKVSFSEQVYKLFREGKENKDIEKSDVHEAKSALLSYINYTEHIKAMAEKLTEDFTAIANSMNDMLFRNKSCTLEINTDTDGVINRQYNLNTYSMNQFNIFMKTKSIQVTQVCNMYMVAFSIKLDSIIDFVNQNKEILVNAKNEICDMNIPEDKDETVDEIPDDEIDSEEEPEEDSFESDPEIEGMDDEEIELDPDEDPGLDDIDNDDTAVNDNGPEEKEVPTDESYVQEGYLRHLKWGSMRPKTSPSKIFKDHKYDYLLKLVDDCKSLDDINYLKNDLNRGIQQFKQILNNVKKCEKYGECKETEAYYNGIKKLYLDKGVTSKDIEEYIKWCNDVYRKALNEKAKELRKSVKENVDPSLEQESYFFEYELFNLESTMQQDILRESLLSILEEDQPQNNNGENNGGSLDKLKSMADSNSNKAVDIWRTVVEKLKAIFKKFQDMFIGHVTVRVNWLKKHEKDIKAANFGENAKIKIYDITKLKSVQVPDLNYQAMKDSLKNKNSFIQANKRYFANIEVKEGESFSQTLKNAINPSTEDQPLKGRTDINRDIMYNFCVNDYKTLVADIQKQNNIIDKARANAERIAKSIYNEKPNNNTNTTDTTNKNNANTNQGTNTNNTQNNKTNNNESYINTADMLYFNEFDEGEGTKSIKTDLMNYFSVCTSALSIKMSVAQSAFNEYYRALQSLVNSNDKPSNNNTGNKK